MSTQTVSQLSLNPALLEKLFWLVEPDHTVLNALIDQISDPELSMRIDEEVNRLVNNVIKPAFIVGWKACRNPDALIFNVEGAGHD